MPVHVCVGETLIIIVRGWTGGAPGSSYSQVPFYGLVRGPRRFEVEALKLDSEPASARSSTEHNNSQQHKATSVHAQATSRPYTYGNVSTHGSQSEKKNKTKEIPKGKAPEHQHVCIRPGWQRHRAACLPWVAPLHMVKTNVRSF